MGCLSSGNRRLIECGVDYRNLEGRTLLLAVVGLLVLVFVGMPLGSGTEAQRQGSVPYIPPDPRFVMAAGRTLGLRTGDPFSRRRHPAVPEPKGVLIRARVPKSGHTDPRTQFVGSEHTATIKVHMRADGVVIALR